MKNFVSLDLLFLFTKKENTNHTYTITQYFSQIFFQPKKKKNHKPLNWWADIVASNISNVGTLMGRLDILT